MRKWHYGRTVSTSPVEALTPGPPRHEVGVAGVPSTGSDARQARAGRGDGVSMAARSFVARGNLEPDRAETVPQRRML